jgi:hypothetical protein
MSRFIFAALGSVCLAGAAAAQPVPGRDLLEFPVGLLAEAGPLSNQMIGGLWNPATAALPASRRAAFGFAGLTSPQELGVSLDLVAGAYRVNRNLTASLSLVSASVSDVLKTDTDPQSLGPEIPYGTLLISAGVARTMRNNVTLGVAARYRRGTSDIENSSAFTLDAGVVVDGIAGVPVRVAASTFLFTPVSADREAMYSAAADVPVYRRDSTFVVRLGQAFSVTEERGREQYSFTTMQYRQLDLSTGVARSVAFGNANNRWRLGCGLRYASYTIAIGREAGAAGVGASYQFLIKRVVQ